MSVIKKLSEEEIALLEIISHPLWFSEFIKDLDPDINSWEYTEYQKEILCDFNPFVSICCGRAVGKTISLVDKLCWYGVNNFWNSSIVYTVPSKVHMDPVFFGLSRVFRSHPLLKHYVGKQGINSQTFTVRLNNGTVFDCRIAGQTNTGANVVGLHVPVIIVDEAGLYNWGTWIELWPCLNTWDQGFQLIVSGVPTGIREKNILYNVDQVDRKFTKHRVTAHRNPRYTEEDEIRNLEQYGGKDSEDYIHMVLGQHGNPAFSVFDRARMLITDYSVWVGTLTGQKIKEDPTSVKRMFSSLTTIPRNSKVVFGVDLGYTEPTVIIVLYKFKEQDPWKILVRMTLRQVDYPIQEEIIDGLHSMYNPYCIAIDEGSSGKALIQHMLTDVKYAKKNYSEIIVPVMFRSNITIGVDDAGQDIEVRAKQFAVQYLQTKVNNHEICFSLRDEELIIELEGTTYTKTQTGELIFKTMTQHGGTRHADDHNLAALLCFVVGIYTTEELSSLYKNKKVKLFNPRWF